MKYQGIGRATRDKCFHAQGIQPALHLAVQPHRALWQLADPSDIRQPQGVGLYADIQHGVVQLPHCATEQNPRVVRVQRDVVQLHPSALQHRDARQIGHL